MLLSTFLLSDVEDESAPASFGGNMRSGTDQKMAQAEQMTNPIHHAPIHRGSRLSIPGSVQYLICNHCDSGSAGSGNDGNG